MKIKKIGPEVHIDSSVIQFLIHNQKNRKGFSVVTLQSPSEVHSHFLSCSNSQIIEWHGAEKVAFTQCVSTLIKYKPAFSVALMSVKVKQLL